MAKEKRKKDILRDGDPDTPETKKAMNTLMDIMGNNKVDFELRKDVALAVGRHVMKRLK